MDFKPRGDQVRQGTLDDLVTLFECYRRLTEDSRKSSWSQVIAEVAQRHVERLKAWCRAHCAGVAGLDSGTT